MRPTHEHSSLHDLAGVAPTGARFLMLIVLFFGSLPAQAVVRRDERSKECVICHITWGDDYQKLEGLLPPARNDVTIDGYKARNSNEDMCFSCHDGYVADDRALFGNLTDDPHLQVWHDAPDSLSLRLDNNSEIYCGTCHTPHDHRMGRKYAFEPFMRRSIDRSQLCLECHQDHSGGGSSHPIHAELASGRSVPGAPEKTAGRVECLSCHQFHAPGHLRIQERAPMASLCLNCHDQQASLGGSAHDLSAGMDAQGQTRDLCIGCHTMHGAKGADLWGGTALMADLAPGEDVRCIECHRQDGLAAEHLPDEWGHPLGVKAPEGAKGKLPLPNNAVGCVTCHDPHRGPVASEAGAVAFQRKAGPAAADLCITCHQDQAAVLQSDHGSAEPAFVAASRTLQSSRIEQAPRGASSDCAVCHITHGGQPFALSVRGSAGTDAGLCLSCHGASGSASLAHDGLPGPTSVGEFSHPIGTALDRSTMTTGTVRPGSRMPSHQAEARLACVSCHDPHRWSPSDLAWHAGSDGDESSSFLRVDNREGGLCLGCHQQQAPVARGAHKAVAPAGGSACIGCHTPHNAAQEGLMRPAAAVRETGQILARSPWPKGDLEWKNASWTTSNRACLACHSDLDAGQRVPGAWAHPDVQLIQTQSTGDTAVPAEISCLSCHNPHLESAGLIAHRSEDTNCAACHGDEALWRYRFFHDPERRRP